MFGFEIPNRLQKYPSMNDKTETCYTIPILRFLYNSARPIYLFLLLMIYSLGSSDQTQQNRHNGQYQ